MNKCRHWGQSYHDSNRCTACMSYVSKHLRRDKKGNPYIDESVSDESEYGFVIWIALGVILGWTIFKIFKW